MVKVKIDLTNKKFGALTVISQVEDYVKKSGKKLAQWRCQCDCGNFKNVIGDRLKSGDITSCGCGIYRHQKSKKYNTYDLTGEYGICYAHNTNNPIYFDLEDYDLIKDLCWSEDKNSGYAKARSSDNEYFLMHRLVTHFEYDIVDHINRQKLDNRKINLRNATKQINSLNKNKPISTNTSGFTGVRLDPRTNKWIASICVNNKTKYLGTFIDKKDAIKCRLKAEKLYFKEFAPQRHLFKEYGIEDEPLEEK